jgi:hypothetical protein
MKKNPMKEGTLTANAVRIGTVTRKMVRARAVELAVIRVAAGHFGKLDPHLQNTNYENDIELTRH